MYNIEKCIPIPPQGRSPGPPSKYPWAQMEVGDSFFVPGAPPKGVAKQLKSAASQQATRHGRRYATRLVEGGVRVWRIS